MARLEEDRFPKDTTPEADIKTEVARRESHHVMKCWYEAEGTQWVIYTVFRT
jgi:hypothetical protein